MPDEEPDVITGEMCPFCNNPTLSLMEMRKEVPFFGNCLVFSMDCSSCKYHKADVEAEETKPPTKYTIEVNCEDDMKIRVVKSSDATVKVSNIGSIEPGQASNGYITNIEGVLSRIKRQVEFLRDESDDESDRKKAKNMVKKLTRVMWGQESVKLTLEDPSGNSAIISDKAVKSPLKFKAKS
ncbi:MAG: ZPR1 zinc finger domain-containing protein [Nanoarchaeota archaeon]